MSWKSNGQLKYYEKKQFKEKKEKLEEFSKTNVEIMMENRNIILSPDEKEEMNAIDRKDTES